MFLRRPVADNRIRAMTRSRVAPAFRSDENHDANPARRIPVPFDTGLPFAGYFRQFSWVERVHE